MSAVSVDQSARKDLVVEQAVQAMNMSVRSVRRAMLVGPADGQAAPQYARVRHGVPR